jgi:hypothetical protein
VYSHGGAGGIRGAVTPPVADVVAPEVCDLVVVDDSSEDDVEEDVEDDVEGNTVGDVVFEYVLDDVVTVSGDVDVEYVLDDVVAVSDDDVEDVEVLDDVADSGDRDASAGGSAEGDCTAPDLSAERCCSVASTIPIQLSCCWISAWSGASKLGAPACTLPCASFSFGKLLWCRGSAWSWGGADCDMKRAFWRRQVPSASGPGGKPPRPGTAS